MTLSPQAASHDHALLDLQRRRIALTQAVLALRDPLPPGATPRGVAILLAALALRRSRRIAERLLDPPPDPARAPAVIEGKP